MNTEQFLTELAERQHTADRLMDEAHKEQESVRRWALKQWIATGTKADTVATSLGITRGRLYQLRTEYAQ